MDDTLSDDLLSELPCIFLFLISYTAQDVRTGGGPLLLPAEIHDPSVWTLTSNHGLAVKMTRQLVSEQKGLTREDFLSVLGIAGGSLGCMCWGC